jgi:acyl-[acyl-carrier-protein]-phospholipid O-acyltransferase/long-chain-fatty-acid--[acyl-carrier-protein] ligase
MPSGQPPLFFQRRFWPMWTALSLGAFSDNVLRQSLLIGISYGAVSSSLFGRSDNAIPFIGALLPFAILLFTPLSGQLADKYETSMMFRRTKFAEILLMTLAAFAFWYGFGTLAIIMLFGMGAQSAFFSPVRTGAMPKYLATDELVRGNGLCNAGLYCSILIGYMVGGSLIATENGGQLVGVVLLSASTLGWLASLRTLRAAANDPGLKIRYDWFKQVGAMARLVATARGVAPPLLGVGVFFLLSTAVTVVTPLYARDSLNGDAMTATALNGLFAVGAGLGAIFAAGLAKGRTGLGFSTVSVGVAGLVSILIFFVSPMIAAPDGETLKAVTLLTTAKGVFLSLLFLATSALMGVYIAPLQAAIQRRAPAPVRARIMASGAFANAAFAIPGSLATFAITNTGADPSLAFLAVAAGMIAISAVMFWRRRTLPAGLYDEILKKS